MNRPVAAALLFVVLDTTRPVDVVCPVDGTKFKAVEIVWSDDRLAWGGMDSDFCRHAFKTLPMEHYVWTCPTCGYSGMKADFDSAKPIPDELKRKLRESLRPIIPLPPGARQQDIPGHVKYDLFAQVEELRGRAPGEVAVRRLQAAWAARQAGAVRLEHFDEWDEFCRSCGLDKPPLELGARNRSEYDLERCAAIERDVAAGRHKGLERSLALYTLAHTYRRRGENEAALRWLDELASLKGENSIIDDACARMRASIEIERTHQRKAADGFRRAIEDEAVDARTKGEYLYQLGEIARRLGNAKEASESYARAIEVTPDPALRKRAEAQRALLK